jgi:hypothetical protein
VVTASETRNADLFEGPRWCGNFGIVFDFQFRLNPARPTVLAGPILWYVADSPRILGFYRDWISDAPTN